MNVGDLVQMKRGKNAEYSTPGLVIALGSHNKLGYPRWVRVHWLDEGNGIEKERDLEVISESR